MRGWLTFALATACCLEVHAKPVKPATPKKAQAAKTPAAPPVLAMLELRLKGRLGDKMIHKSVQLAHPKGWEGDVQTDGRAIRLLGPNGEGEILIAAMAHPAEIQNFLNRLKKRHPSTIPSPPSYIDVHGINPQKGERATRFEVTGRELGELVTIERGDVIVLYATIVEPNAWAPLKAVLERCYPTVTVTDRLKERAGPLRKTVVIGGDDADADEDDPGW